MVRGNSIVLVVVLATETSGCWLDPTCTDSCDGTAIKSCSYDCPHSNDPVTIAQCDRQYGGTDCALSVGASGQPKTCKMLPASANGSPERPFCVDPGSSCDASTTVAVCTGPSSYGVCTLTLDGGFLGMETLDVCAAGSECHTVEIGGGRISASCAVSPLRPCDPASGFPYCLDLEQIVRCRGTEPEGYVEFIERCTRACAGNIGSASCT